MRKTILLMLGALLTLSSCAFVSTKGSAKDVAERFADAYLVKVNVKEMENLTNDKGLVALNEEFLNMEAESPDEYKKHIRELKAAKLQCAINEDLSQVTQDSAIIRFDVFAADGTMLNPLTIVLKRDDDESWKVDSWRKDSGY